MYINALNFNTFPIYYKKGENTHSNQTKSLDLKDLYPKNYNNYFSFKAITPPAKEFFPTERLYDIFSERLEFDKSTKLVDVHKEYYAPLLKCKDIDDVKRNYPEFSDVKVGSYLKSTKDKNVIRNIAKVANDNLTLMNSSLKFIQAYYAKAMSIPEMANLYRVRQTKVQQAMESLNIPIMKGEYSNKLYLSRKDSKEDILIKSLPAWQQRTIAKNQGEVNGPNKIKKEQMLSAISRQAMYEKKLADASFVSVLMPLLFETYNNPNYKKEAFSIITDKLADKWQDDRYLEFVRKEPIEPYEKELIDKLSEGMSDSDKKKMKVYINSAILSWKKQPTLNTRIYKEMKLTPTVKEVVEKAMNGKEITFEDEKVLKYFHSVCAKKIPRYSQIIFEQQKELLTEWSRQVGQ